MKRLLLTLLALACAPALRAAHPTPTPEPRAQADWDCGGCDGPVSVEIAGWPLALGDTRYNVYVSELSGKGYKKVTDAPIQAKYLDLKGVAPGRRYYVVVTTVTHADGQEVESRPSTEFGVLAPGRLLPLNQVLGQCRDCKGSTQMNVAGWPASQVQYYNLYMSASANKGYLRVNDKPFNQAVAVVKDVAPGTLYYFTAVPVERVEGKKDKEGKALPPFMLTAPLE